MKILITESQYKDFLKKYSKKNQNSITLLELKSMISENKKNIISELEMVELGDTSYSNVGYDRDGTQNDKVYKGLLDDINAAAKNAGIKATITTAKTGHAVHTKGGKNVSRHMKQVAVDVAVLDGIGSNGASNETNGNPKFRELGNKLKDELVKMGYVWNTESGKQKAVLWQTTIGGNHFNHLHISNKGNATEDELNAYANNVEPNKTTQAQKTPEKSGEEKKEKTWAGRTIEKIKKLVAPRSILNDVRDGSVELKYGTKSDQVMQLQKDLKKVGLFNVEPTGYYGPITVRAVKSLQSMEGIQVDGIFGDMSYKALYDTTSENTTEEKNKTDKSSNTTSDNKSADSPNKINSSIDVILMGGLDNRKGDLNIEQQVNLLKKNLGNKNVVGRRYTDIGSIKDLVEKNPNAYVVLFSAGGSHSAEVASIIKNKNKLFIVEPYASSQNTSKSVQSAISSGVPSKNVVVGPSQGRGAGVVDGTTKTPNGYGHWDALGWVGTLIS